MSFRMQNMCPSLPPYSLTPFLPPSLALPPSFPPFLPSSPLPSSSVLLSMPAYAGKSSSLTVKLISVYPGNSDKGLPSHQGAILVFSSSTGSLQAVCNRTSICGRKRTLFHSKWLIQFVIKLSLECFIEITPDFLFPFMND